MIARLILLLSIIAIVVATLTPGAPAATSLPFLCLRCGTRPGIDVLLNVLLFLPFGAALGLLRVRARWVVLLIIGTTSSIEFLQFVVIPGRYASIRDILSNSIGGMIGWQLAVHLRFLLAPPPRTALKLGCSTAGLWLLSQAFTSWALGVVLPPSPWWAQIKLHDLGFPAVFRGTVVRTSLGTMPISYSDRLDESARARELIRLGQPLQTIVTDVTPSRGTAPIVVLATNDDLSEIVSLLQKGSDVAFRVRTRSSTVGIRSPGLRLSHVFLPGTAGDTVVLEGRYADARYTLRAIRSGHVSERSVAPSASWVWMLVMPVPHYAFGEEVRWLTALWLFVALGLSGFWGAQAKRRIAPKEHAFVVPAIAVVIATVAGLCAIPIAFGIPVSHWSEWIAAGGGVVAGWVLGHSVAGG